MFFDKRLDSVAVAKLERSNLSLGVRQQWLTMASILKLQKGKVSAHYTHGPRINIAHVLGLLLRQTD